MFRSRTFYRSKIEVLSRLHHSSRHPACSMMTPPRRSGVQDEAGQQSSYCRWHLEEFLKRMQSGPKPELSSSQLIAANSAVTHLEDGSCLSPAPCSADRGPQLLFYGGRLLVCPHVFHTLAVPSTEHVRRQGVVAWNARPVTCTHAEWRKLPQHSSILTARPV